MAKKMPRTWMLAPERLPASPFPERLKTELEAKANELVETVLKPRYVKPPPKKPRFNYITDLWTKWHGGYFYFGSTYACPGPTAISPSFESRFARLKHVGSGRFNLSYMRHNDK